MDVTKRIPVVIVGAGNVADTIHIPIWRSIKNAELVAICDSKRKSAEEIAKKWKIPKLYTEFEGILEEENEKNAIIDICTPPNTHVQLSIKAMEADFNVILEKPMAMSIEDCERILNEHKKRKVKLCIIHNFLFEPPMLKIRSLLERRRLDILGADIRMLHTPEDEMISARNHWVHTLPGGRFGECLIHPVYVLRNLIGELNIRDVYATKRGTYDWVSYDELFVSFNADRKFGSIYISFNSPRWSSLFCMKIYCKELIISYDGTNGAVVTQGPLLKGYLSKDNRKYYNETKILKDSAYTALQTMSSVTVSRMQRLARKIIGKKRSGHKYIFESVVKSILEDKEVPYPPKEAFDSTKVFLKIIHRLQ